MSGCAVCYSQRFTSHCISILDDSFVMGTKVRIVIQKREIKTCLVWCCRSCYFLLIDSLGGLYGYKIEKFPPALFTDRTSRLLIIPFTTFAAR